VRRSEIWIAAAGSGYAGKPRPVVIIQDDRFDAMNSVTVCAFTTDPAEAPLIRLLVEPDYVNGLRERCSLRVDNIITSRTLPLAVGELGAFTRERADGVLLRLGSEPTRYEAAAFNSATTFFSTAGVHSVSAYDVGHIGPSSSFAASSKPSVA
jgi:mRNA-degrading endonuclease toxin of MazEF toxin-antitoxin module